MRRLAFRGTLAAWAWILVATVCPAKAKAEDVAAQVAELRNTVRRLEKENQDLRERLSRVERQLAGQPRATEAGGAITNDPDKAAWRKIRVGMKGEEISSLLGQPERVVTKPPLTFWYYPKAEGCITAPSVSFKAEGMTVYGWEEP